MSAEESAVVTRLAFDDDNACSYGGRGVNAPALARKFDARAIASSGVRMGDQFLDLIFDGLNADSYCTLVPPC